MYNIYTYLFEWTTPGCFDLLVSNKWLTSTFKNKNVNFAQIFKKLLV